MPSYADASRLDVDEDLAVEGLEGKQQWEDTSFSANDGSLYLDVSSLPDYANTEPRMSGGPHPWLRPHEFSAKPKLFIDGATHGDVIQGQLNDCWLLGAFAMAAAHPDQLIKNLVVSASDDDCFDTGIVTFQFFKNDEWVPVTVDTRLPYGDPDSTSFNAPIYGRSRNPDEHWVALMEKAYAKLHSNYQLLQGGSVAEALGDITGGAVEKLQLSDPHIKEMVDDGILWHKLKKYMAKRYIVGCSKSVHDGGFEADSETGLLLNHAYSVLHLKDVGALKFVKVRNPWGQGDWRGDWSDAWVNWDQHPDVESALLDDPACNFNRNVKDGTFWMVWEDFVLHFTKLYVCRVFGEEWNQCIATGTWQGESAAGSHKYFEEQESKVETPTLSLTSNQTYVDGDPRWFQNPQYRLTCTKPTKATISLTQADRKLRGAADNVPIRFVVLRDKRGAKTRVWEEMPLNVVADSTRANFASPFPQREVVKTNIQLDPKYSYVIVPHTLTKGHEGSFTLRVFSPGELNVDLVQLPHAQHVKGFWNRESAGGALRIEGKINGNWGLNPQYWVVAPGAAPKRKVTIKIVVRRTDRHAGKDDKSDGTKNRVGIVVTRVQPDASSGTRRRKLGEPRTNALGQLLPTKESSLKKPLAQTFGTDTMGSTGIGAGAGAGAGVDNAPKKVPARKLEVVSDEFCMVSDFSNAIVATSLLTVPGDWLQNGLVIHPCLRLVGREGAFKLDVYSSVELSVKELAAGRTKTVPGQWTEKSAMGSHLHPDWKRNPAYEIVPRSRITRLPVTITVSRPEERWKGPAKQDSVGCMLGFYIVTCDRERDSKFHDGRSSYPNMETNFVPMHSATLTTQLPFDALPDGKVFLIVPATFEPGKQGPFNVSVTMEADFTLRHHK